MYKIWYNIETRKSCFDYLIPCALVRTKQWYNIETRKPCFDYGGKIPSLCQHGIRKLAKLKAFDPGGIR